MKCKKCDFVNETGSIFCESCGEKISKENVENSNKSATSFDKYMVKLLMSLDLTGQIFRQIWFDGAIDDNIP